jgi:carboxymethylenebutenolidase
MNQKTTPPGTEIEIASGETRVRGILVDHGPAGAAVALVLVPDVHGVSPLYREIAGTFADAGFPTLVLDIYSREGAPQLTDMAAVQNWIAALPDARVLDDIGAAIRHLRHPPQGAPRTVGIVGFCLGGQYALMAGCRSGDLAACVAFYGMLRHIRPGEHKLAPPLETATDLRCPLLGLFGADDLLIPRTDVDELRAGLARSSQRFDLHVFPGAGHAFMNDRRPDAYRREVAREAMRLTIDFLRETLA